MIRARRIIYPVLLTVAVIVVALLYPLVVIILSAGAFAFLLSVPSTELVQDIHDTEAVCS